MSDYRTRLQDAIVKAHEAGDTEAAEMLAKEYKQWSPKSSVSAFDSIKQGMKDPIDAGAQLLEQIVPEGVKTTINSANNYLAEKTGLFPKIPQGGVDQLIRDNEKAYQQKRGNEAGTFDGWRLAGNVTSPANLAIASRIPMTGGLLKTMGGGAALSGATVPVLEGDFATEKAKQVALGGAFAPVGNAISRVVSPRASMNKNVSLLRKEGVTPSVGQTLGGTANRMEEKAVSLPLVGDMIRKARNSANDEFESAAFNRVLKPIGEKLPNGMKGHDAVSYTKDLLRNRYDSILDAIGTVKPDGKYLGSIKSLENIVKTTKMPNDKKLELNAVLDMIKETSDDGIMTSEGYKMLESALSKEVKRLSRSSNIFDNKMSGAVKQVRQELRDLLERQSGDLADDLANSNSAYAQFKRVEDAASKVGAEGGSFTPNQLNSSVKTLGGKAQFASGNALMQDLTSAGKTVLGNTVPNSGTADRLMLGIGASGGAYALDPMALGGLLGTASLYSKPAQSLLNSAIVNRPSFSAPLAEALRNYNKYILPAAVSQVAQ